MLPPQTIREIKRIMKKRKTYKQDQSLELAAAAYRDCILFGDPDRSDQLLDQIRPHCERLMTSYGIEWDNVLEQFLHATLLGFCRFDGEGFLSYFLRNARYNFDIPDRPINVNPPDFHGTGLTYFREKWESQPERAIGKIDRERQRKKQQL